MTEPLPGPSARLFVWRSGGARGRPGLPASPTGAERARHGAGRVHPAAWQPAVLADRPDPVRRLARGSARLCAVARVLTLCCIGGLWLLRWRAVRKHPLVLWIFAVSVLLTATTGGLFISRLGGWTSRFSTPSTPSAACRSRSWCRCVCAPCFIFDDGAVPAELFGSHPQHLRYPHLPSVLMVLFSSNCAYVAHRAHHLPAGQKPLQGAGAGPHRGWSSSRARSQSACC